MKKKNLLITAGLALALGLGVGAAVSMNKAPIEANAVVPAASKLYFNVSEFGPTYGDKNEYYTNFSVSAAKAGWKDQTWLDVTYEDRDHGIISVPDSADYVWFIVVRSNNATTNTWPNGSSSWNQTANISRTGGENYGWIWTDESFADSCTLDTIETTAYLSVNGSKRADLDFNFTSKAEYFKTDLSLNGGDAVTITIGSTTYGYSALEDKDAFDEGENHEIVVKTSTSYEFYWKTTGGIWAQIDSELEANNFATTFKSALVCDNSGVSEPTYTIKEGETYWSWSLLGTEYAKLTNGAKNILYAGGATLEDGEYKTNIADAMARYDWVIYNHEFTKFVTNGNGDYRNVSPAASLSTGVMAMEQDSQTAFPTLIAVTFISVAAGAGFFFLRRRKEN